MFLKYVRISGKSIHQYYMHSDVCSELKCLITPCSSAPYYLLFKERDRNSKSFKSGSNSSNKRLQHQIYDICEEEEHMELDGMTSSGKRPSSRLGRKGGSSRILNGDESTEPLTNDVDFSPPQETKKEKPTFQVKKQKTVSILNRMLAEE